MLAMDDTLTREPREATNPAPISQSVRLTNLLRLSGAPLALLTALVATGWSLWFSEGWGWPPCDLCWYQRILMYPLVIIVLVGMLRRDAGLHLYGLPFSGIGMFLSLYHFLLIKTDLFPAPPCRTGFSCTVQYLDLFGLGFINIPFLAMTAFIIITFALACTTLRSPQPPRDDEAAA
jgi:disulfide bond formation protein DsbB